MTGTNPRRVADDWPTMEQVRGQQRLDRARLDVKAVARTIHVAEAAGMDAETQVALRLLLDQLSEVRDDIERELHAAGRVA